MTMGDDRWVEVSPSPFDHERKGLEYIRDLLPDVSPYRAWSNFEFRDSRGGWHEVDLLVLGRGRLHLIELKAYTGVLQGNDHTWLRAGKRPESSPVKLARRKAQYLASRLTDELFALARETNARVDDPKKIVPFVQQSVFLHHPHLVSELSGPAATDLYGFDGATKRTNLPGISERLLEPPHKDVIGPDREGVLATLIDRLRPAVRAEKSAGSWVIQEALLSEGEGWQDWRGYHHLDKSQDVRIRFLTLPAGAPAAEIKRLEALAGHEFSTMSRLHHDGLLRPKDLVHVDGLGPGLVYPLDARLIRLDHWLAAHPEGLPLQTQLHLVRQIAEAVHYAHGSAIAHRDLSPEAIWIREPEDSSALPKALVGDWRSAGSTDPSTPESGVTRLHSAIEDTTTADTRHVGFRAPEGAWRAAATDRYRLDVFGIGALAFYLLTGTGPATSAADFRERLRTQGGLDLSLEVPEASEELRSLVLGTTRPSPTERTPDLAAFLAHLATAERTPTATTTDPGADPLDASPGTLLGERYELVSRLGQGSTAVGLLVLDRGEDSAPERVLKVALDDAAAARLRDEADVLRMLKDPRIVALVDGPVEIGGREVLVLESAGRQTLAESLRERDRLSLDLLERYGSDLVEALGVLDRAGVAHRDIKPANLGIRARSGGNRANHLVLFDFSLTRAAASSVTAGTPPYLDPFLTGERDTFDSAAERYAVAVVLYEMATGLAPYYGDPGAHPGVVPDDVTIDPALFDPSIAAPMAAFFARALARDAEHRHHTAGAMLNEWRAAFPDRSTTVPDDADDLAARATAATPLAKAGLTAHALSALEPLGVETVGDLISVDAVKLNHLPGSADITRREVKSRAKDWRDRLLETDTSPRPRSGGALPAPVDAGDVLMEALGRRSPSRRAMLRLILGIASDADAFATHAELAAHLPPAHEGAAPPTPARATQILGAMQDAWAGHTASLSLLDSLVGLVRTRLTEVGGVATVDELVRAILAETAPRGTSAHATDGEERRLAAGLLRIALDRARQLVRAETGDVPLHTRRRDGQVILLATDPALLDAAEELGRLADRLVAADAPTSAVVPAATVERALAPAIQGIDDVPEELIAAGRLATLGAGIARRAAASSAGELHHRDLTPADAVALALRGTAAHRSLTPHAVRERTRVRFPSLPPLPERPALDAVVSDAGLGLTYDTEAGAYRPLGAAGGTTGLHTNAATQVVDEPESVSVDGVPGQRLRESAERHSFLALAVPAHRLPRATRVLTTRFGAAELDLTEVLVAAVRAQAATAGMSWATVQSADAAADGTTPARGLAALVARAVPEVTAAIEAAASADGDQPVLLTGVAPLARYGHLGVLAPWTDLSRSRGQAIWLALPQLRADRGAVIDGHPVPLNSPGQLVHLDAEWLAAHDPLVPDRTGAPT
ncbi:BREX system serine/threonine kinase PglW [Georgenia sp. Z1344]|uniref:BREX system serine/threonine kinase PglW n=1 Tax=Georgenia sp. Z1344 TaxID=3416706 RepID=UPI003CF1B58C